MTSFKHLIVACCTGLVICAAPVASAQSTASSDEVFQGLGGKPGIQKVVDTFLPIVLADARIKDSFMDVDMVRLARLLGEQFCVVSGGPCKYSGKELKTIHEDLHITHAQFNALAEDLQLAMEQQGVPSRIQNKLVARLAPMQRDVVTK
jgi:hemoglobin